MYRLKLSIYRCVHACVILRYNSQENPGPRRCKVLKDPDDDVFVTEAVHEPASEHRANELQFSSLSLKNNNNDDDNLIIQSVRQKKIHIVKKHTQL